MEVVLRQAFPSCTFEQNPAGKPQKGAFEVVLLAPASEPLVLFSKLTSFGPAKAREALPDPLVFVTQVVAQAIRSSKDSSPVSSPSDSAPISCRSMLALQEVVINEAEAVTGEPLFPTDRQRLEAQYRACTVFELRRMLAKRKLPTAGRKVALVDRMCDADLAAL